MKQLFSICIAILFFLSASAQQKELRVFVHDEQINDFTFFVTNGVDTIDSFSQGDSLVDIPEVDKWEYYSLQIKYKENIFKIDSIDNYFSSINLTIDTLAPTDSCITRIESGGCLISVDPSECEISHTLELTRLRELIYLLDGEPISKEELERKRKDWWRTVISNGTPAKYEGEIDIEKEERF